MRLAFHLRPFELPLIHRGGIIFRTTRLNLKEALEASSGHFALVLRRLHRLNKGLQLDPAPGIIAQSAHLAHGARVVRFILHDHTNL